MQPRARKGVAAPVGGAQRVAPATQPGYCTSAGWWAASLRTAASEGKTITLGPGRVEGGARDAKVFPPSESETGRQTCWTKKSLCFIHSVYRHLKPTE